MILLVIISNNILLNLLIKFTYHFISIGLFFYISNSIYLLLEIDFFIFYY